MGTETLTPQQPETLTADQQQALWDELAAERDGSTATTPPTASQQQADPQQADSVDATASAAANTNDADTATTGAGKTEPDKPDPLAELMAKIEKLEGRQRNVEGHIGGLKDGQQRMLDMLTAAKTAAANVSDAPTQTQVNDAIKNPAKWEALKGEFPEWASATEELFDARLAAFKPAASIDPQEIERIVSERVKGETDAVRKEIVNQSLEAVFPGWQEEVRTDAFGKWLNSQPADIKALADSPKVGDAARMLRLYESAREADPSEAINQQRKQKLAAAASTPKGVRVPQQKAPDEMSPQELWEYEAAQREKRQRERGY